MKKKLLALGLTFAMVFSMLPVAAMTEVTQAPRRAS